MSPQSIYESAWHHPGALLPPAVVVLALAARRFFSAGRPAGFFASWLLLSALDTALDCWLTSYLTPLGGGAARGAAIAFVITGDLRLYALLERYRKGAPEADAASNPRAVIVAVGWSLVASVLVALATRVTPGSFGDTRRVFLLYEVISLGLMGLWGGVLVPRMDAASRGWMARVTGFFAVQYALWVAADVMILSGVGAGWLLRLVPNAMYYCAFVAFAWRTAPGGLR